MDTITRHILKASKPFFEHILSNDKRFEVRKDDRGFKVGDEIILEEWDEVKEIRTGRKIVVKVNYILQGGQFGLMAGHVVMSFKVIQFHV